MSSGIYMYISTVTPLNQLTRYGPVYGYIWEQSWKAESISETLHRTSGGIQREFNRQYGSGLKSAGRGSQDKIGYLALRNHPYCVDL